MTTELKATVLELENQVWMALVTGDQAADSSLLADDFLGVYPSGFAVKADHAGQLDDGPSIAHYQILDARIQTLSPTVVLLSYLARYVRLKDRVARPEEAMYVTSIWRQSAAGGWQNIFSQDTPVE